MWWVLQLIGCSVVCLVQMFNRSRGVCLESWALYSATAISVTYLSFARSFHIAPNFTIAWMFGQTALNVLGMVAGMLFFKDTLSTMQWVGVILSITGGYLLIR